VGNKLEQPLRGERAGVAGFKVPGVENSKRIDLEKRDTKVTFRGNARSVSIARRKARPSRGAAGKEGEKRKGPGGWACRSASKSRKR